MDETQYTIEKLKRVLSRVLQLIETHALRSWTDIQERKPEEEGDYLVIVDDHGEYKLKILWFSGGEYNRSDTPPVVYWTEIPTMPEND